MYMYQQVCKLKKKKKKKKLKFTYIHIVGIISSMLLNLTFHTIFNQNESRYIYVRLGANSIRNLDFSF
jgi:hypothetical protein